MRWTASDDSGRRWTPLLAAAASWRAIARSSTTCARSRIHASQAAQCPCSAARCSTSASVARVAATLDHRACDVSAVGNRDAAAAVRNALARARFQGLGWLQTRAHGHSSDCCSESAEPPLANRAVRGHSVHRSGSGGPARDVAAWARRPRGPGRATPLPVGPNVSAVNQWDTSKSTVDQAVVPAASGATRGISSLRWPVAEPGVGARAGRH